MPMPGITLGVEGNNKIKVSGIDKEDVGEMAAEIRALRPRDIIRARASGMPEKKYILSRAKPVR